MEEGNKKRRLGKGLSELLGEVRNDKFKDNQVQENEVPAVPRETFDETESMLNDIEKKLAFMLPIEKIEPNTEQPRREFNSEELQSLANSISEFGIIQPLVVIKSNDNDNYLLVAGERRWRASQIAGLKEVPVILKDYDMSNVMQVALIENIQRSDLNPIEEAMGYMHLINKYEMTQNELGTRVGKSRSYIANMMRMLNLDQSIQDMLKDKKLSVGHAKILASLNEEDAKLLANEIITKGLNVRDLEKRINKSNSGKHKVLTKSLDKDEDTLALEADLAAALGITVKIDSLGGQKGNVVLSYSSLEELDEICKRLCHVVNNIES